MDSASFSCLCLVHTFLGEINLMIVFIEDAVWVLVIVGQIIVEVMCCCSSKRQMPKHYNVLECFLFSSINSFQLHPENQKDLKDLRGPKNIPQILLENTYKSL